MHFFLAFFHIWMTGMGWILKKTFFSARIFIFEIFPKRVWETFRRTWVWNRVPHLHCWTCQIPASPHHSVPEQWRTHHQSQDQQHLRPEQVSCGGQQLWPGSSSTSQWWSCSTSQRTGDTDLIIDDDDDKVMSEGDESESSLAENSNPRWQRWWQLRDS